MTVLLVLAGTAAPQPKLVVGSVDDLPQFSYPITGTVTDILTAPPGKFEAVVAPMRADIVRSLASDDITDSATLRNLLQVKLGAEIARGNEDA